MSARHLSGNGAPVAGCLVDHQHPLGHGCVGCWWPNAATDAGRGLWIPDLSGYGQHAQFAGSLPTWAASRGNAWGVNISSDAARWLKAPLGPAANLGTGDYSAVIGLTAEATMMTWGCILDCRTKDTVSYGWSLNTGGGGEPFIDFCDAGRNCYKLTTDGTPYVVVGWSVIVITCDRDGYARSYKNGAAHGTADISSGAGRVATPESTGYLRICSDPWEGTTGRVPGIYEYVYIYDHVLSPEEVAWHYREPAAMIWVPGRRSFFYRKSSSVFRQHYVQPVRTGPKMNSWG